MKKKDTKQKEKRKIETKKATCGLENYQANSTHVYKSHIL